MKNPINMTPQELIENGFDRPKIPCVEKLNREKITGAFKIGKLRKTPSFLRGKPVFLTESGELVICEAKVAKRINQRLEDLKND